jgi:predicted nucleotidyltransferase
MVTLSDLQRKRAEILKIAAQYGADNVRVFGSVVRGEAGPDSDLDILVHFSDRTSLIDHIALMQDLEEMLGVKVDVVSEKGLHPLIRDSVLSEVVAL